MFLNCHPHGCVLTFFHVMDVIDVSNYICCANFHQPILSMLLVTPMDHWYLPTLVHANPSIISFHAFWKVSSTSNLFSSLLSSIWSIHGFVDPYDEFHALWWNFTHVMKLKKRGR
jgi:hypothetical protein